MKINFGPRSHLSPTGTWPASGRNALPAAPCTVHRVLASYHCPPLAHLDRAGRVIRRQERDQPGELIHVDIKKLGRRPHNYYLTHGGFS